MKMLKFLYISFADDALPQVGSGRIFEIEKGLIDKAISDVLPNAEVDIFRIFDKTKLPLELPSHDDYHAVIIGGSSHFVRELEGLSWSSAMVEFIQTRSKNAFPTLGICFGHQLMAHALGGKVEEMSHGRDFGVLPMRQTTEAAEHILFQDIPETFHANVSHGDYVQGMPENTRVLALSDTCDVEAVEFAPSTYGVQFHPEYSPEMMMELALSRIVDEASRDRFAKGLSLTPHATKIVGNFVRHHAVA